MKSRKSRFSKQADGWQDEECDAGRPRKPAPQTFKLQGVKPGDPMIEPALCPTRQGQKEVIVSSLQKTIIGLGVAHVTLANDRNGRTYPISAHHLPEEALKPFRDL